ncbi:hypothetical protein R5H30_14640 [Sulfitobacter sp. D35]|uniref:hypothetical protein n=1 Tax=Sulfitobacter sp. D35 TaxID=3083252 RepID=UPI00296F44FF|nr:hypothetical protein [Sulfitobacter sp. D35]MDW4499227.1 hypothetical protein [Sulfitobacter sp. D35]
MPFEHSDQDAAERDDTRAGTELRLIGQPPLQDHLDFVTRHVVGGDSISRAEIIDAWRVANDHYAELEETEAGLADGADCLELPETMKGEADALTRQPYFRKTFDKVPTHLAMVELNRLVASQRHVTLPFVKDLATQLSPRPDDAALFRFCQPVERKDAEVSVRRLGRDRFAFFSDSNDLRFHDGTLLSPDQVSGHQSFGPVAGNLGLFVGHGSNFLTVVRSDERMVLHNGYHRACALRMAGFTHAPAIVQTVTRRDELEVVAASAVVDDPAFYFRTWRPPLLKDFFDPSTTAVFPVRRKRRVVEVTYTVTETDMEDI